MIYNSTIKQKSGSCIDCLKENNDESQKNIIAGRCTIHYQKYRKELSNIRRKQAEKPTSKTYKIPKATPKRLNQLALYRKKRDVYLREHLLCEVHDCNNNSNQLHHKKGRSGELVHNEKYFMACCSVCHPKRIHETEVEWAKENEYVLLR